MLLHPSHKTILKRKYFFFLTIALIVAVYAGGQYLAEYTNANRTFDLASVMHAAAANAGTSNLPALEMFLRFDSVGIQGDVTDDKHKNELMIDSFMWGEQRGVKDKAPGMQDFVFTMPISKASPKLFLYGAGGSIIPKAVLTVRTAAGKQEFLKWTFTNVVITSYKTVGNTHGDGIVDQVSLSFDRLQMEYNQLLPNGTLGPTVSAGFDRRTNSSTGK